MRPIPPFVLFVMYAMSERPRGQKTTDVGLEPTASALGGLRATIAPTGQMLLYDKICFDKVYIVTVRAWDALFRPRTQNKAPSGHVPAKFGSLHPFILLQVHWSFAFRSGLRWIELHEARIARQGCERSLSIESISRQ